MTPLELKVVNYRDFLSKLLETAEKDVEDSRDDIYKSDFMSDYRNRVQIHVDAFDQWFGNLEDYEL